MKKDGRRHPRWVVGDRPGTTLFLSLLLSEQQVGLERQVVRSVAHRCEVGSAGERDLIYRTGLEFMEGALSSRMRQESRRRVSGRSSRRS
ncbi:MAG: hypothetical protein V3R69_07700 [candidate division NC10 bacterium]|nr:hypothetical protein [candidate division NC10 bacterium]MCH7897106.1 hypothetical protein [candidate division NC10 bacterium]MCZ6551413.1 hypothetical protein [candidate division NC10 bacterium]